MADEQQFLTPEGAATLRNELDELKNVKRPALAAKLKEAIAQGDLSENAEYIDAKEQQAFLEGRINHLENLLRSATIISDSEGASVVRIGVQVVIQEQKQPIETYLIVGAAEADPAAGKVSNESPLGAALIGHKVKDKVTVKAPGGEFVVTIKAINKIK
jgi:transcription elongation factor GreA